MVKKTPPHTNKINTTGIEILSVKGMVKKTTCSHQSAIGVNHSSICLSIPVAHAGNGKSKEVNDNVNSTNKDLIFLNKNIKNWDFFLSEKKYRPQNKKN